MRIVVGAATHVGRVRSLNEDSWLAQAPIYMVADGMGGHDAGDKASALAVGEFAKFAGQTSVTAADLQTATEQAGVNIASLGNAGTTIAGVTVTDVESVPHWLAFNLGDSRVYQWGEIREGVIGPDSALVHGNGGFLRQISTDHSLVQEMLDAGEISSDQMRTHAERHVVTKALSPMSESVSADYWVLPISAEHGLLMCSDGLTDELSDTEILSIIQAAPDVQHAADNLVNEACAAGGRDNVTVVLVFATTQPAQLVNEIDENTLDSEQTAPRPGAAQAFTIETVSVSDHWEDEDTLPGGRQR